MTGAQQVTRALTASSVSLLTERAGVEIVDSAIGPAHALLISGLSNSKLMAIKTPQWSVVLLLNGIFGDSIPIYQVDKLVCWNWAYSPLIPELTDTLFSRSINSILDTGNRVCQKCIIFW